MCQGLPLLQISLGGILIGAKSFSFVFRVDSTLLDRPRGLRPTVAILKDMQGSIMRIGEPCITMK